MPKVVASITDEASRRLSVMAIEAGKTKASYLADVIYDHLGVSKDGTSSNSDSNEERKASQARPAKAHSKKAGRKKSSRRR